MWLQVPALPRWSYSARAPVKSPKERGSSSDPDADSATSSASSNFASLAYIDMRLFKAAARAELALARDPVATLVHLRLFGELLTKHSAARMGTYDGPMARQQDRILVLSKRGIPDSITGMLTAIRVHGNRAVHAGEGTREAALTQLTNAYRLSVWFLRVVLGSIDFDPGPFVPPQNAVDSTQQLRDRLAELRTEADAARSARDAAKKMAREEAEKRLGADEAARRALEERDVWMALAEDAEAELISTRQRFREVMQRAKQGAKSVARELTSPGLGATPDLGWLPMAFVQGVRADPHEEDFATLQAQALAAPQETDALVQLAVDAAIGLAQ